MQNSNLIKALKTLSEVEMRDFGKFVNSPFHNGRTDVTKFFEQVKKFYPGFDNRNLTSEKIYEKMYPGKHYDDMTMRRLVSFLLKILESYLVYIRFSRDDYNIQKAFLKEAGERKLMSLYERKLREIEREYSELVPPVEEYFLKKYYLVEDKINNYLYKTRDTGLAKDIEDHAQYLIEFLLVLLFQNKFTLFLHEVEFKADYTSSIFNRFFNQIDFPVIISYLEEKDSKFYPYIAVYYYELMSLLEPEKEENILNFKKLLNENSSKFSWLEKRDFYYILVSVCTLMIEKGDDKYKSELIYAYEKMLEQDICSEHEGGFFSAKLFRNIVAAANIAGEFDWLERFIKENTEKLDPADKDTIYNLSMALLNYEREEFGKTLENILAIDIELVHFKIDVRYLTVKTYYELGYYEQLLSSIDAFRHFLSSDKHISERIVNVYSNFCSLTGRLAKIRLDRSFGNLPSIKKEIRNLENKATSDWLMKKADEMEK